MPDERSDQSAGADDGHSSRASGTTRRLAWLAAAPNDSLAKTLLVTISVCLVCSIVVSTSAVLLRPRQLENRERERKQYIVAIMANLPGISELVASVDVLDLEARVVRLETGEIAHDLDPRLYDQRKAAVDPTQSISLPDDRDPAGLGRRANYATVYIVRREARPRLLLLPVRGSGFESMMYGYLAVDGDTNTIKGLTFYQHEETPGLGARVSDPQWLRLWQDKKIRDEHGLIRVKVAAGEVDPNAPDSIYQVDAISGATWTSKSVTRLLQFWLGDDGFGPFLDRVRRGEKESQ